MNDVDINVVFDWKGETRKGAKEGTVSIKVYEHNTRKRKYVSCGVRVAADEWNEKLWVVRRADAMQLNNKIREQHEKCVNELRRASENAAAAAGALPDGRMIVAVDMPTTRSMKVDRKANSFLDFMLDEMKKADIKDGTAKHHRSVYNELVAYAKIKRFEDITREKMEAYVEWAKKQKVTKLVDGERVIVKRSQTTVNKHWKTIHKYITLAQVKGYVPVSAVLGVEVEPGEPKPRVYLNDDEIKKWCQVELPNEHLRMARDRFIVQMGTGLPYGDVIAVDWSFREKVGDLLCLNGQRLKNNKPYFCVILDFAEKVLERWGWQVPSISNNDYNIYLDEIAKRAGIRKHVTSHVGRHTYACYCLRHGVRLEAVQRTLGHRKITTTQIYAKLAGVDVVDAFKNFNG